MAARARGEVTGKKLSTGLVGVTMTEKDDHDPDCLSVAQFCKRNNISIKFFYKRPDLMPPSFLLGARRLITREANENWRRERNKEAVAG
jgi:hypothetical protein